MPPNGLFNTTFVLLKKITKHVMNAKVDSTLDYKFQTGLGERQMCDVCYLQIAAMAPECERN